MKMRIALRLRVFIIEPSDAMRESLLMHVESLGHEVITASSADLCPHYHSSGQSCLQENACGDALILGQDLPALKGIDFIERRITGGCKGAAVNNAIICRPWSYHEQARSKALGCRFFETPIHLSEISEWLKKVADSTSPNRQLASLPGSA